MTWRHYEAHHHSRIQTFNKNGRLFCSGFHWEVDWPLFFWWVMTHRHHGSNHLIYGSYGVLRVYIHSYIYKFIFIYIYTYIYIFIYWYMNPSQETSKNTKHPRFTSIRPGQQSKLFQWAELHSWELIFLSKIREFATSRALSKPFWSLDLLSIFD